MKALHVLPVISLLFIFLSCQSSNNEDAKSTHTDTTSVSGFTGEEVKLVKTASLNFKVHDLEKSTKAVSVLARSFGGMVFNQVMEFTETNRNELRLSQDSLMVVSVSMPQTDMTVRVPSENLEAFVYGVAELGYFTNSSRMNIDDRSLLFLENLLKQKNRNDALAAQPLRKDKGLTTNRAIEVKDEAINKDIANRSIDADVKYSTINLILFQNPMVRKETIANYAVDSYKLAFSRRLANALNTGWEFFVSFLLAVAHFWMFALVTILAYISYKLIQQKRRIAGMPNNIKQ